MTFHNLITAILVYLSIGLGVFACLCSAGMVQESYRQHGDPVAMVLASIRVVCVWPAVAFVFFHAVIKGRVRR